MIIRLFLLFLNTTAGESLKFNLTYKGDFPEALFYRVGRAVYERKTKLVNLLGKQQEFIVVKDKSSFKVLQFVRKELWQVFDEVTFADSNLPKNPEWVTGDSDNDGKDEIILFQKYSITKYEWDGEKFEETVYEFPYLVGDALIGDINNDNFNELVLCCYEKPLKREDPGCEYYLCIVKVGKETLDFLWTDKGKLGYVNSNIIPSDNLVCIADVENIGYNQLVMAEGQSDVSPTRYNLLVWNKSKVELNKSFIVSKGTIITEGHIEEKPFLIGDFKPIDIKGEKYFLGCMEYAPDKLHQYAYFPSVIFEIKDNFKILKTLELTGCVFANFWIFWINIDGKGKGILQLHSEEGKTKYLFYR